MDDYIIDGDLVFSDQSSALKFYREQYHKKKEWQGLTAKDLAEIPPSCYEGAIWADAKLREKNSA